MSGIGSAIKSFLGFGTKEVNVIRDNPELRKQLVSDKRAAAESLRERGNEDLALVEESEADYLDSFGEAGLNVWLRRGGRGDGTG